MESAQTQMLLDRGYMHILSFGNVLINVIKAILQEETTQIIGS